MIVAAVVRMTKPDVPQFFTIPSKVEIWGVTYPLRAPLSLVLGLASGVLEKRVQGVSWTQAIVDGLAAGSLPVWGHETVVNGLRGGRDIGESKEAFRRRTTHPPADPGSLAPVLVPREDKLPSIFDSDTKAEDKTSDPGTRL